MSFRLSVMTIGLVLASQSVIACAATGSVTANSVTQQDNEIHTWRSVATAADVTRIEDWKAALQAGKEGAVREGYKADLDMRAPLFHGDAALPDATLPAGLYNCSVTKLGDKSEYGLDYIAYPKFRCRVTDEGAVKHFAKLSGSQLTIGWIYPEDGHNNIYLGSGMYGYENTLTPYGTNVERDEAAIIQRVGPAKWRMIFPYPYYESLVDVMELTPLLE